ncbi:hypothetical protein ACUW9N_001111 [Staphylococcus auricularis]|uniref:5,10-methylene-tetrahydrofolate dehydrogenase n=1 Tax=Staphylococcus auricularis TaxID=29379 RepID=UPI001BCCB78C|nr:5,10-methylene-tetrahydrofolate dehydrogenase [Staphylococcus auricularis]
MSNQTISIGIVAAPGVPARVATNLETNLPDALKDQISDQVTWDIHTNVDPLTGSAEHLTPIFEKISDYQKENEWDYTIAMTDLPLFKDDKVIAIDINKENGASVVSIPAYGWRPMQKRLLQTTIGIIKDFNTDNPHPALKADHSEKESDAKSSKRFSRQFPLTSINQEEDYLNDTGSTHKRYIVSSKLNGMIRLLSGMTFANNPLTMMSGLSNVLAIAFTTGAFGIVFTTMWNLSYVYSEWRLFIISCVAIFGMMIWIVIAHDLWEPLRDSSQKRITMLYNLTTLMTLFVSLLIYFVILFCLFLLTAVIVLPPSYLGAALELNEAAGVVDYINLGWFAASISTVAGAIGAGLNNTELILESTYGYRQKERYNELNEAQSSDE